MRRKAGTRPAWIVWCAMTCVMASIVPGTRAEEGAQPARCNVLLAIADDQSFPYASAYGDPTVATPAFDRVARLGVLFRNGFCASPGCSPSRAALLTGRHCWQIEEAGTHASSFPQKYVVYPDLMEQAGYHVGYTGKGWGPGNWKISGRERNPAGPAYQRKKNDSPSGISKVDYAGNFEQFLDEKPAGAPFCFWYGGQEPHRAYQDGIGAQSGKRPEDATVPSFLPDHEVVRNDLLDYAVEIEWFDRHLGRILNLLEERGELERTLIIVTADNGMPFPRAKANGYEYGVHVPLAICCPQRIPGGRTVHDLVGFVDLTPTILEVGGVAPPAGLAGRSLWNVLGSEREGVVDATRIRAYAARERHSSSRWKNWTYPQRILRTPEYLYIRNFRPDRWPAGDPAGFNGDAFGYYDIDACPTKTFLVENRDQPEIARYFHLAVDKRPAEELFDIRQDPGNLTNLAGNPAHERTLKTLREEFEAFLKQTGDPRVIDGGEVFETYTRFSPIREFPQPE